MERCIMKKKVIMFSLTGFMALLLVGYGYTSFNSPEQGSNSKIILQQKNNKFPFNDSKLVKEQVDETTGVKIQVYTPKKNKMD